MAGELQEFIYMYINYVLKVAGTIHNVKPPNCCGVQILAKCLPSLDLQVEFALADTSEGYEARKGTTLKTTVVFAKAFLLVYGKTPQIHLVIAATYTIKASLLLLLMAHSRFYRRRPFSQKPS